MIVKLTGGVPVIMLSIAMEFILQALETNKRATLWAEPPSHEGPRGPRGWVVSRHTVNRV